MQDKDNHTPRQHISQMSQQQIVAGVKRIIAERFSEAEITELKKWLNGAEWAAGINRRQRSGKSEHST